jgi:hypothetical protein
MFMHYVWYSVVSSNPACCEVSSIQHYVIKFVSDLCRWFSPGPPISSYHKIDHHDQGGQHDH